MPQITKARLLQCFPLKHLTPNEFKVLELELDEFQQTICTFDFLTGEKTERHYTKAKIVDMALVMEGSYS